MLGPDVRLDGRHHGGPGVGGGLASEEHLPDGPRAWEAGRREKALEHYARAAELSPEHQLYAFRLGSAYLELLSEGGDAAYFEPAEENLLHATRLGVPPQGGKDVRGDAWLALGDLYAGRDMTEEAERAYERAREFGPQAPEAEKRLQELGRDG